MKAYLFSTAIGALVGIIYGLLNVKSPAPPVVALVGLFAMPGGASRWSNRSAIGAPLATPHPLC